MRHLKYDPGYKDSVCIQDVFLIRRTFAYWILKNEPLKMTEMDFLYIGPWEHTHSNAIETCAFSEASGLRELWGGGESVALTGLCDRLAGAVL